MFPGETSGLALAGKRRVMVIGSGGSGKSTFARGLARRTGLPLIHLDRHYWKPGWVPTPDDEWIECVRRLSDRDAWIMDGNYGGTLSLRIQRCDAVVFFDLPRLVCMRGVLTRWFASRFRRRSDLPQGCSERMRASFLRWIWQYPKQSRPRIEAALRLAPAGVDLIQIAERKRARAILDAMSTDWR